MKETSDAHSAMYKSFTTPDPHSVGVQKILLELYPALSKKIFESDGFMSKFVLSGMNAKDILEFPVCGKCEAIAALDGFAKKNGKWVNKCTCMREGCYHTTIDPVTFKVWIMDEIRKKHKSKDMDAIETAFAFAIDATSMAIKRKADAELLRQTAEQQAKQNRKSMMADGAATKAPLNIEINWNPLSDEEYKRKFDGMEIID